MTLPSVVPRVISHKEHEVLATKNTKITARRSRNQSRAVIKILCLLVPLTRLGIVCQKNKLWRVSVTKKISFVLFVSFVAKDFVTFVARDERGVEG